MLKAFEKNVNPWRRYFGVYNPYNDKFNLIFNQQTSIIFYICIVTTCIQQFLLNLLLNYTNIIEHSLDLDGCTVHMYVKNEYSECLIRNTTKHGVKALFILETIFQRPMTTMYYTLFIHYICCTYLMNFHENYELLCKINSLSQRTCFHLHTTSMQLIYL